MRTGVYKYRDGINFNFRVTSSPCGKVAVRVDKSGNLCVTGPRHVELRFVTELIDKHYEELRRDPRLNLIPTMMYILIKENILYWGNCTQLNCVQPMFTILNIGLMMRVKS